MRLQGWGQGTMPRNLTLTCQKIVPYSVRIANNSLILKYLEISDRYICKIGLFGCSSTKRHIGGLPPADPHVLGDQSFWAARFCAEYSIAYTFYCVFRPLRSFLKLSAALFLVKVACSTPRRVDKCDDLERNLKMSSIYLCRIRIS